MKATLSWMDASSRKYLATTSSSTFVHLGQYTAELHEAGDGSPTVMIPGLAGGVGLLGPLARAVAGSSRAYSYQLRGESDCFTLRYPFDLDDLVDDLAELLDTLRLESPTIMGLSFGGIIALKFAIRYPYRLGRLVVQGVGARFEPGLIHQIARTVLSRFPLPADNPFVNQFFNLLFGCRQKQDSLFEFVTRQVWQTDQSVMAHRFRLIEQFEIEDQLHRIKAPTLIMSGDRDVLVSQSSLRPLVEGIANAQFVRLPNCGHLAFVTRPEAIVKHLAEAMAPVASKWSD